MLREFIGARTRPQTFAQPSEPAVVIERVRYLESHLQVADDPTAVTCQLVKLMGEFKIGGKQQTMASEDLDTRHILHKIAA